MFNTVNYFDKARLAIFKGIEAVNNAVKVTMGPKGRNVMIDKQNGNVVVTNDGVTVAGSIQLADPLANMGAGIVKQAAEKTNTEAGDGTTSTVLLTYAIAKEGLRHIAKGVNPFKLTRHIKHLGESIVNELKIKSLGTICSNDLRQIAILSAQDEEIGNLIADSFNEVGYDGTVAVEEGSVIGLTRDIVMGMQFEQGYISPYFVLHEGENKVEIDNPLILITDQKIVSRNEISELIEALVMEGKRDIVIIADDVEGHALQTLLGNKTKLHTVAIKAPSFGEDKINTLEDIAILTGGTVIAKGKNMRVIEATENHMGTADKIIVTKDKTTIVNGHGTKEAIDNRVESIKAAIKDETKEFVLNQLHARVRKLAGGVATIKVGCPTAMETQNKKFKIEDAIMATKSAQAEGVIVGGGLAFYRIACLLKYFNVFAKEQKIAKLILQEALQYPIKQIIENAGYNSRKVLNRISGQLYEYGFNAETGEYGNLSALNVIDPVKVLRISLENAISAACMLLTTDAVITEDVLPTDPYAGN